MAVYNTWSRCSRLECVTLSVTLMLESNSYVRCLLVDFSKAFDVVRHALVLGKLSTLGLPSPILNWIVHFLTAVHKLQKLPMVLSLDYFL